MLIYLFSAVIATAGLTLLWISRDAEVQAIAKLWLVIALVLALLPFTWGCARTTSGKLLNGGVVVAGVADLHSTRVAIDSGKAREANPLLDHGPLAQAAIKSLGIGAVLAGAWWLDQKQQRVLAHVARLVTIAVWSAAALHNYRITRN